LSQSFIDVQLFSAMEIVVPAPCVVCLMSPMWQPEAEEASVNMLV